MTGEGWLVRIAGLDDGVLAHERGQPQPGDRPPAPGELVLLQAFINTHFDLVDEWGADLLSTPERLRTWLGNRGLIDPGTRLTAQQATRAMAVREGLRELAGANGDPSRRSAPAPAAEPAPAGQPTPQPQPTPALLGLELGADGLIVTSRSPDPVDRALGLVLALAARAMIDGRWRRLKVCPGDACGWAFYDHSRNNSGRWCSMAVCGGRTKSRSHYRRRRATAAE